MLPIRKTEHKSGSSASKGVKMGSTLPTTFLAAVFFVAGLTEGAHAASVSQKDLKAKLDYCEVCHGIDARGFVGYFPIPRLAGQQVEYIENELNGFVQHK